MNKPKCTIPSPHLHLISHLKARLFKKQLQKIWIERKQFFKAFLEQSYIEKGQYLVGLASDKIQKMKYKVSQGMTGAFKKSYSYHFYKYIPPGVHNYCFATQSQIKKNDFTHMRTLICKPRDEEIELQIRYEPKKKEYIKRIFSKPTSVFSDFHEDNKKILQDTFKNDW